MLQILTDLILYLFCFSGLRKLAWKHLAFGMNELRRAYSLSATVRELQKFVPALTVNDVARLLL